VAFRDVQLWFSDCNVNSGHDCLLACTPHGSERFTTVVRRIMLAGKGQPKLTRNYYYDRACDQRRRGRYMVTDMDDHLSKPINLEESGDKLERCGDTETELARGRGYDAEDLLQRVGGDHFLLKEVIGIFLAESPELLSRLDRAVKNQDPDGLATTAHSLKGELGISMRVARRTSHAGWRRWGERAT